MGYESFLEQLPPVDIWGERVYTTDDFNYPEKLNAASELLDRNVREGRGERTAIQYRSASYTYHELQRMTNKMGNALIKLGVKKGDRILLRFPNNPTAVGVWLATLKIGAVAVMIMPMLRAREIAYRANDAECTMLLCNVDSIEEVKKAESQMPTVTQIFVTDGIDDRYASFERIWENESAALEPADLSRGDLALIGYTSGSTGDAKGTVHFQDDVLAIADGYAKNILAPNEEDVFTGHPSLSFTFGLGGLLVFPFRFGASVVLLDQFTPENMLKTIVAP
jgi:2-aminobenzoate-CoA ligase